MEAASTMSLRNSIRFQKALALAASASNPFEAEAAELAARRLMETCNIDPTRIPNGSLYSRISFTDNPLLKKLRNEWCEQHPEPVMEKEKRSRASFRFSWNSDKYAKARQERTNRRKPETAPRKPKIEFNDDDREQIRLLLNAGFSMSEVGKKFSTPERVVEGPSINSACQWQKNTGKWLRENGQWQWAKGHTKNEQVVQCTDDYQTTEATGKSEDSGQPPNTGENAGSSA